MCKTFSYYNIIEISYMIHTQKEVHVFMMEIIKVKIFSVLFLNLDRFKKSIDINHIKKACLILVRQASLQWRLIIAN